MDYIRVIGDFIAEGVGCSYIKNEITGQMVFVDSFMQNMYPGLIKGSNAADFLDWEATGEKYEAGYSADYEQYDMDTKKYFLIRLKVFEEDGDLYRVVNLVDISEAMQLSRDVANTGKFYRDMDQFKTKAIERLSGPYYTLLPLIEQYVSDGGFKILRSFMNIVECYSYDKSKNVYPKDYFSYDEMRDVLAAERCATIKDERLGGEYECMFSGKVANTYYALIHDINFPIKPNARENKLLIDSIRLYIENGLMREEIVYESEHDKLTGLYNKGKYLYMYEHEYKNLNSIGIFNYDLNYLKRTNDNFGHEAGDKLLKRAADSIRAICTKDTIHGYRMGGDEYLCVIVNPTKQEVENLEKKWNEELEKINSKYDDFPCVVAIGSVFGGQGYDFDELMHEADTLMYEDKKRKKKPGEEIR